MEQIDPAITLEPLNADLAGVAIRPDSEFLAILFVMERTPDKLQPVIVGRPAAVRLLQHLRGWLEPDPTDTPSSARH